MNYEKLYQGQRALPKDEGVPQAPNAKRKNHVVRTVKLGIRYVFDANDQQLAGM